MPSFSFRTRVDLEQLHGDGIGTLFCLATCDDTSAEVRHYIDGFYYLNDTESQWKFYNSFHPSQSLTLTEQQLSRAAYQASRQGQTTVRLEELCFTDSAGCTCEVVGLIDIQQQLCYAIQIKLQTTTSSLQRAFSLYPQQQQMLTNQ